MIFLSIFSAYKVNSFPFLERSFIPEAWEFCFSKGPKPYYVGKVSGAAFYSIGTQSLQIKIDVTMVFQIFAVDHLKQDTKESLYKKLCSIGR